MKRLLKALIVLLALFMVVGCSAKKEDPEKLYKEVYEKMAAVKSMGFSLEMDYALNMDGSTLDMNMDFKGEIEDSNAHMVATVSALGYQSEIEEWLIDGMGYIITDGEYSYTLDVQSDLDAVMYNVEPTGIEKYELNEVNGKKVLSLTLSMDGIKDTLSLETASIMGDIDFDQIEISPVEVTLTSDYYVESMLFTFKTALDGVDAEASILMTFSDYNSAKVSEPDYELWESATGDDVIGSEGYTPTYDIVKDITDDDEAALAAIGFEKVDEHLYLNAEGTISIDTEWKYFTLSDGTTYAEYDWEYQIANDYTEETGCSIDYEYEDVAEECTPAQIETLNYLHETFEALWALINN